MNNIILYKEQDSRLYIRALGHITANICFSLKNTIFKRFKQHPLVKDIFLDLSHCNYMDSTFMGLLLGIDRSFNSLCGRHLGILRPTKCCKKLFSGLKLNKILKISKRKIHFPHEMDVLNTSENMNPEFILKVHEELTQIAESNHQKFRLLKELLKKKIDKE